MKINNFLDFSFIFCYCMESDVSSRLFFCVQIFGLTLEFAGQRKSAVRPKNEYGGGSCASKDYIGMYRV